MAQLDTTSTELDEIEETTDAEETADEETSDEDGSESDDEDSDDSDSEDDVDEEELAQAKTLARALKNPAQAKALLDQLTATAKKADPELTTQEAKKAVADVLREALKDEKLFFLAEALGPALEKLLDGVRSEFSGALGVLHQNQLRAQAQEARDQLNRETKGDFAKLESTIMKLMEETPVGNNTPKVYLRKMYRLAKAEESERQAKAAKQQRQKQNSGNPLDRLHGISSKETTSKSTKSRTTEDTVNAIADKLGL
jgi:hypothetical protein